MPSYKMIFVDDRPEQFEAFRSLTLPILNGAGIDLTPLHYTQMVFPVEGKEDVRTLLDYLEDATEQQSPYDLVITDLNFELAGLGGGHRDGLQALKLAAEHFPQAKLILITAFPQHVSRQESIDLSAATRMKGRQWIELQGSERDWSNRAENVRALCEAIDQERMWADSRIVPDLYEVMIMEDSDIEGENGMTKHLRVQIVDKQTGIRSDAFTIEGDHARLFEMIACKEGDCASSRALQSELNRWRAGGFVYEPHTPLEVAQILLKYGVQLVGELPVNHCRPLCRHDNDVLCEWQREEIPPVYGDEGYGCLAATRAGTTRGYCPKLQRKGRLSDRGKSPLGEDAIRGKIKELRSRYLTRLRELFGPDFDGEDGLIRTVRRRGMHWPAQSQLPTRRRTHRGSGVVVWRCRTRNGWQRGHDLGTLWRPVFLLVRASPQWDLAPT